MTKAAIVLLAMIASSSMASAVQSQQENFQDRAGRVTGWSATDSPSPPVLFDEHGRIDGRVLTDSQGSIVYFDAQGRITGRESTDNSVGIPIYDDRGRVIIRKSGLAR